MAHCRLVTWPAARSFLENWVKKETSFKLQAAMQQDTIYLQRLKQQATSDKLQATSRKLDKKTL
jgi:hypothetical protein